MMNKFITAKLQRFVRSRQLHTIISQETIRPSSPTPSHLKTYNLSLLDQFSPDTHTPCVFFFQNYNHGDSNILKQSLSKCLKHYYPFAGRLPNSPASYINCHDQGVEFLEAFNDGLLDDFIHKNEQHESIDELFPFGLSRTIRGSCPKLLEVQLNHFAGGGAAVALSMSHKLVDAMTMSNFINHWASITRGESPINPCFLSTSTRNKIEMPKLNMIRENDKVKYVTRKFIFPNSKVNELKNNVIAKGTSPVNPTRVEVVTSLLFKHAVSAAKMKSGSLKASNLAVAVNMRNKFVEKYPETAVGSIFTWTIVKMVDDTKVGLSEIIADVKKGKMELEGIRDEQKLVEKFLNTSSTLQGDLYYSSSTCRIPFYEVDFGWGKPVEVIMRIPHVEEKLIILMDTPSGDGITAHVNLPEEEMAVLLKDNEFLTYVKRV